MLSGCATYVQLKVPVPVIHARVVSLEVPSWVGEDKPPISVLGS